MCTKTSQESPESGLNVLPDGRVQVIFDKIGPEEVAEFPKHVYNLVQEFSIIRHKDATISPEGLTSLYFILEVAKGMIPDYRLHWGNLSHQERA